MKMINQSMKATVATAALLLAISGTANAGTLLTFANGDFEGFAGNTNSFNSAVPPGWTITGGTPDVFDANTNLGGMVWGASSTGGDFLHGIGLQPSWTESAQQLALTGLTIGEQYEISFEQSIARASYTHTGGFWRIIFGTEEQFSDAMTLPTMGTFDGWDWQTMIFTATATSQHLTVSAISDTDGVRTDLGIDSFYLGSPGDNPDNPDTGGGDDNGDSVPAPAALGLFGLGLMGLGLARRRRKD